MQFPFDQSLLMPPKQVAAMQSGMDMYTKLLQAIATPEMLKTQKQMNQANLEAKRMANQYYPQSTQADIAYKNAQVPYLGAQTAQTQEQTKEMPNRLTIDEQNAYNRATQVAQSQARFNKQSALGRYLSTDIGKATFGKNPEFAAAASRVMNGLASDADYAAVDGTLNSNSFDQNLSRNMTPGFRQLVGAVTPQNPQNPSDNPSRINNSQMQPQGQAPMQSPQPQGQPPSPYALSPDQIQALQNSPQGTQLGANSQPPQMPIPNAQSQPQPITAPHENLQAATNTMNSALDKAKLSPDHTEEVQRTVNDILEKKSTTTALLNQRAYANIFNNVFDGLQKYLPAVYKFTGPTGRTKLMAAKLGSATNLWHDPDLDLYNAFETVQKPQAANELRRQMGSQATDAEINKMIDIMDPSTAWFGSKSTAKAQIKAVQEVSDATDKALVQGTTESKQNLMDRINQPSEQAQSTSQIESKVDHSTGRVMLRLPGKPWIYQDEIR